MNDDDDDMLMWLSATYCVLGLKQFICKTDSPEKALTLGAFRYCSSWRTGRLWQYHSGI